IGKKILQLPCFFASVSSVKTSFSPADYVEFLEAFGYPSYLVSAYDVINSKPSLNKFNNIKIQFKEERDSVILLDSGNYEAYWLRDSEWNSKSYDEALKIVAPDMFLSFDSAWNNIQADSNSLIDNSAIFNNSIPIVHGNPVDMASKVIDLATSNDGKMIAIPERELGDGIIQRAKTLTDIRTKLDDMGIFLPLHLLGTGNPLSILLYSACGADSFDGLEWCQTAVNPQNNHLIHFSQRDMIECDCPACNAGEDSYSATTLGHNLLYYLEWMDTIQNYLKKDQITSLLESFVSNKVMAEIGLV
ncbi:MAG TPA: hypothetical protein VFC41_04510, partial [Anaerovoracaceae bacterium]|nr:hypothetical protein [Anaerovoracaceae bacterium]